MNKKFPLYALMCLMLWGIVSSCNDDNSNRDADIYTYTDMENAEFYEDEYSTFYVWYYDGVNRYLLGNDYTIGDDGLAYHDEDGLVYPAGWIPEEPYDPAVDWGANWMDSWDI